MITLKENITVSKPPGEVFRYVSDFRNIAEWDPGVTESIKENAGPVNVGTRYRLKLRYGILPIAMKYTVKEYDINHKVVLEGRGEAFQATDTLLFFPHDRGTRIEYRADLVFSGLGARVAPLFKGVLRRIGKNAVNGLKQALDRDVSAPKISAASLLLDRSIVGGMIGFTSVGFRLNRKFWNPMPSSLEGRTAVITGATSGIGKVAALRMSELGARIALVARDAEKARLTKKWISDATGNPDIEIYMADMGRVREISRLVDHLNQNESSIDILVNNAGALYNERLETDEGIEKTLATDLLGPFVLTRGLIPKLKQSSPSRVINVSSGGMYTQKINVNDLQFRDEPFDGAKAYARAKRGLVILTEIWAEQLKDSHVSVHAMHPGWVRTPGIKQSLPRFYEFTDRVLRTPDQGADTIVWLAAAPEAALTTGKFWLDRMPRVTHVLPNTGESEQERRILWQELSRLSDRLNGKRT